MLRFLYPVSAFVALVLGACAAPAATVGPYKAVLVAGDDSVPAFDNAVDAMAQRLLDRGAVQPGDVQRLSAAAPKFSNDGVRSASLSQVLGAIRAMQPGAGQGCFVFATSHGVPKRGLVLGGQGDLLNPAALDRALTTGCGAAPTIVILSGCFSGSFARPPMARPNRVILTAARQDRPSFGCEAGRTYTVYDRCLLDAVDAEPTWERAYRAIRDCVAAEERIEQDLPSEPQAYFGLTNLAVPHP